MKKVRNIIIVFCLAISSFFFTSCKNFLSGNDVLEELNKSIDYLNLPYVKVYISADSEGVKEILPATNIYEDKYKKGDKIQLSVQEKDDYYFTKWTANPENAVLFTTEENESPEMQRVVTAEIVESVETITIKPEILRKEFAKITIAADSVITKEIIPPANVYNDIYKTYDTIDLSFTEKGEYQFVYWDVEPKDFVEFISKNNTDGTQYRSVTAKILRADKPITIKPVVMKRPEVLLYSPMYNSEGAYRDAKIQVIFDKPMSQECIFFTNTEVTQIKSDYQNVTLLQNKDSKVYGYQKQDGSICYKNIEIIDKNRNKNILSYFAEPRFEFDDTLIIPTKNGDGAPEPGTNILVKLSNFYNEEQGQKISIGGEFSWIYTVNSKYDTTPPSLEDGCYINIYKDDKNQLVSTDLPSFTDSGIKDYFKSIYLSQNKLSFEALIFDGGSGIALENGCFAKVTRLYDEKYKPITNPKDETLYFQGNITESMARYNVTIDFKAAEKTFTDGLYQIKFYFKDQNGNTTDVLKSAYFLLDNTGPEPVENLNTTSVNSKLITNWETYNILDYSYVYLYCEDSNGNKDDVQKVEATTYTKTNGIEDWTNYTFKVVPYDIFENKGSEATFEKKFSNELSVSKITVDRSKITSNDTNQYVVATAYFDNIPEIYEQVTLVITKDTEPTSNSQVLSKVMCKIDKTNCTATGKLKIPYDKQNDTQDGQKYTISVSDIFSDNTDDFDQKNTIQFTVLLEPFIVMAKSINSQYLINNYFTNYSKDKMRYSGSSDLTGYIHINDFSGLDVTLKGINLDIADNIGAKLFKKNDSGVYEEYSEMYYFDNLRTKVQQDRYFKYNTTLNFYTCLMDEIDLSIKDNLSLGKYKLSYYINNKNTEVYDEFEIYGDPEFSTMIIPSVHKTAKGQTNTNFSYILYQDNKGRDYLNIYVYGKYFQFLNKDLLSNTSNFDTDKIGNFKLECGGLNIPEDWRDSIEFEGFSDSMKLKFKFYIPETKDRDANTYNVRLSYNDNYIDTDFSIKDKWEIGDYYTEYSGHIIYFENQSLYNPYFEYSFSIDSIYIGDVNGKHIAVSLQSVDEAPIIYKDISSKISGTYNYNVYKYRVPTLEELNLIAQNLTTINNSYKEITNNPEKDIIDMNAFYYTSTLPDYLDEEDKQKYACFHYQFKDNFPQLHEKNSSSECKLLLVREITDVAWEN